MVIFLNAFHLTDPQRTLIRKKLLNRDCAVLWSYAPGLFNGQRKDFAMMEPLTGMRIVPGAKAERVRARIVLANEPGASAQADMASASRGDPIRALFQELRGLPEQTVGSPHVWVDDLAVDDPDAICLGRREGGGAVALALKPMRGWTSLYTLNPVLPAAALRAFARYAGVHLYNEQDDTLYASRSYLTLAADQRGRRRIQLPRRVDVRDPFTGERLWEGITGFERDFERKETVIWQLT